MKYYFRAFTVFFLSLIFINFFNASVASAKSDDMGVCFVKVQKRTLQTLVNQIARSTAENSYMQAKMKYYNGLKSLFTFVDTYNYKLFWVKEPSQAWLRKNCFKYGYITQLDFSRRAITRVYPEPSNPIDTSVTIRDQRSNSRSPAQVSQPAKPAPKPTPQPRQERQQPRNNITNHYYYGKKDPNQRSQYNSPNRQERASENRNSAPVNITVNSEKREQEKPEKKTEEPEPLTNYECNCVNFDVPDYLKEPSYFLELNPFLAHEEASVLGSGSENKINIFNYGVDVKLGYRFNQFFNSYAKFRYSQFDKRSPEPPTTLNQQANTDLQYGVGIEHIASRFLRLALEYTFLNVYSFRQVTPIDLVTYKENEQTLNLNVMFNFVAYDDFQLGVKGNFGTNLSTNTENVIYDLKTQIYALKAFEGGYFGANIGYERLRLKYGSSAAIDEVNRNKFRFGLNYGFDL